MRIAVTAGMIGLLVLGSGSKLSRLSTVEREHYEALRVWMSDKEEKAYLKLKTEDLRNAWLHENGQPPFWERFYKFEESMRDAILGGEVAVKWPYDAVLMSWGTPHQRMRLTGRQAIRSQLFVYRFEVMEDGSVLVWTPKSKATYKAVDKYRMEIYVDDNVVTEIVRKQGWDD